MGREEIRQAGLFQCADEAWNRSNLSKQVSVYTFPVHPLTCIYAPANSRPVGVRSLAARVGDVAGVAGIVEGQVK